ncbi:PIG-L family deacetylase [Glycomyces xiaoerkulensis]|uniref:PIG-L family deacetylase n=1 Tax=Glycomyces xiaoerkulensis TaxID=2038139 RepID=UPI0018E48A9B|nr:PIG-L family deacetylase [Glycomyces xiaoerkulensis]
MRRRDLLVGGLAGLAVAAAGAESARSVWDSGRDERPLPPPPRTRPVHLQVVAHPDDCLYFINPRMARVLAAGAALCTVVLTAGESDGRNTRDPAGAPDYAGYSAARNTGLRRAYAHMATGDSESPWDRSRAVLGSGQQVEVCLLRRRPDVQLIFCSLWTNLGRITGRYTRLLGLWEGDLRSSLVLPPTGSPLTDATAVDRETVTGSLLELLDHYRPTVVNTLDPDPDPVVGERLGAEQRGYSDHIDHTAAALFAWDAAREWAGAAVIESWRGYYNRRWPGNLGAADRDAKGRALNLYSWADGFDCGDPVGCGDRVVVGPGTGDSYGLGTHPRYAAAVAAAETGGRHRALTVQGTRLRLHSGPGSTEMGGPDLLPGIATAGSRVFGIRADHTHDPAAHVRDLHCLDLATGRWTDLGNPAGTGEYARRIGPPTAADDGTTALVAVRAPDRAIAVRTKPVGRDWTDWTELDGPMIHDSPHAYATADGRIEIVGATPSGLAIWRWTSHGWTVRDLDLPHVGGEPGYAPAGAVAAAGGPGGRIVLASRSGGSADVVVHFGRGRTWTATLLRLEGGIMPPSVAVSGDGTVAIAADNGAGAAAVAVFGVEALEHGPSERPRIRWGHGDVVLTRRPALAFDAAGILRLWAVGADGALYSAEAAAGDGPPTAWAPARRRDD